MSDIKINIRTQGDVSGVQQVNTSVQQLESQAVTLQNQLSLAFNIDLTRRFVDGLTQVAAKLKDAIDRGVDFNATMQDTADSIRAAMVAASEGALSFDAAQGQATETTRRLADAANRAAVPIAAYASLFARQSGLAIEAGLSMGQWEDVLGDAAVAASNMGMGLGELESRMAQLLSGQVGARNTFAKSLGITQEDLNAAMKAGDVTDYLRGKLAAWQQDVEGLNAAKQRLGNAIDMALGDATVRIFQSLEKGIGNVGDSIANLDAQSFDAIIAALAKAVEVGLNLTAWAADNADAMAVLALSLSSYGTALLALKFGPILAAKAKLLTASLLQTKATHAGTQAQLANNAAKVAGAGASAKLATALTRLGHVGLAAFVGWQVGSWVDDLTGFSETIASLHRQSLDNNSQIHDRYRDQVQALREMAREVESQADADEARQRAITQRGILTRELISARQKGEKEIVATLEQQISYIDGILGALPNILSRNQERLRQEEQIADVKAETNQLSIEGLDLAIEKASITLEELETLEQIQATYELQNKLLRAQIAGRDTEELEKQLALEREAQSLRRRGFTEERGFDPVTMARERVQLEVDLKAVEAQRRADKERELEAEGRLQALKRAGVEAEEESAAERLKRLGADRSERQIGIDGREQEVFFRGGKKLGTEDQIADRASRFGDPFTPSPGRTSVEPTQSSNAQTQSPPTADPQTQPPADTSPVEQALAAVNLDLSPIVAAVEAMDQRLQAQVDDLAGQIRDLTN